MTDEFARGWMAFWHMFSGGFWQTLGFTTAAMVWVEIGLICSSGIRYLIHKYRGK